jgi:DNA-binding transcriptional MocR family regulator
MPINSFEEFPMSWRPDKAALQSPMYRSIAELMQCDILDGTLSPNMKLPPQRELADFLDVSLNTITRAYTRCERMGLVYALTGNGTFVSPNAGANVSVVEEQPDELCIDLSIIEPFKHMNTLVADAAKRVINGKEIDHLFAYQYPTGHARHKHAAKLWMRYAGIEANQEHILVVSGTQNGLAIILSTFFQAGDKVATDPYTYPNLIELAKTLHIQLVPIKGDASGMLPDHLEEQCRLNSIKGIFLMPACCNPTGITMPEERRHALAKIIEKQGLLVIEDDVYDFLLDPPIPAFCTLLPEQTVYLSTISKSVSGGLRASFLYTPPQYLSRLTSGIFAINLKTPALNAEITAELILSGTAREIAKKKLTLSKERNALMDKYFPEASKMGNPLSFFRWIQLPDGFQQYAGTQLERMAAEAGVRLYHSSRFSVGLPSGESHVRVSTCTTATTDELDRGLHKLQAFLQGTRANESQFMI